jgi:hypothetical protein
MVSVAQPGTGHGGTHTSAARTRTAPPLARLSPAAAREAGQRPDCSCSCCCSWFPRADLPFGLLGVGAVRAARDAEPEPDGARGLATSPGPVFAMVLTLPAVIGAVATRIPIRIDKRFGAPSRDQRRNVYGRVRVVDTLLVLVHGCPLMAEPNRCTHVLGTVPGTRCGAVVPGVGVDQDRLASTPQWGRCHAPIKPGQLVR